jgi:hypothetical protein
MILAAAFTIRLTEGGRRDVTIYAREDVAGAPVRTAQGNAGRVPVLALTWGAGVTEADAVAAVRELARALARYDAPALAEEKPRRRINLGEEE